MLAVIDTHPIQYRAPVYRQLSKQLDIPITVIYGSDFSVVGYQDKEFGTKFAWDTDLLSGYSSKFLSSVKTGGAQCFEEVSAQGLGTALREINWNIRVFTKTLFFPEQSTRISLKSLYNQGYLSYTVEKNSMSEIFKFKE
mgnify:CR=1 FL=1